MEENKLAKLYPSAVNIGTEEVTTEDINTPILKIVQPNTQNILNKIDGSYFRSDIQKQLNEVEVNMVYVTTMEVEDYNKTGTEVVKVYFGYYKGTKQPFKMYLRGWGLAPHRGFQTEIASLKNTYNVPMLAFTVKLTTEKQTGTIQDTGKPYTTYKPVFTIVRDEAGEPVIENDEERIAFLINSALKMKELSKSSSVHDEEQNQIPAIGKEEIVNPEEIPF